MEIPEKLKLEYLSILTVKEEGKKKYLRILLYLIYILRLNLNILLIKMLKKY